MQGQSLSDQQIHAIVVHTAVVVMCSDNPILSPLKHFVKSSATLQVNIHALIITFGYYFVTLRTCISLQCHMMNYLSMQKLQEEQEGFIVSGCLINACIQSYHFSNRV